MPDDKKHRIRPDTLARARELRKPQTPAERALSAQLRDRQLGGFKFRRQHPIGRFIVDVYCAECWLAIEIDGDTHAEQEDYDTKRTQWLCAQGYHVVRFADRDVQRNMSAVLEAILRKCEELRSSPSPRSSP